MRVKNGKLIRTLTWRSLKAGRLRNIVAVCAIALTAILFTTVFAIGGNVIESMQNATMRQVGTSSHGGLKYLTQEQYDHLSQSHMIKDISYNIIVSFAENEALQKKQTEIRYGEDKDAKWMFSYPTTGKMPQSAEELACSTLTLDALGVPHELGQTVPLEFTIHGKKYSESFTLCGFWSGDDVMVATQVWLSREYIDSVIEVPASIDWSQEYDMDTLMGTINADVWFDNSFDIEGKMDTLIAERGYAPSEIRVGVNWAYMGSELDPTSVILVIFLTALILISGYLIIYSVFTISVTGDIRFYGLLKTIGATGRQLRRIVRWQALILSAFGIPLGLILGWLLGYALTPVVMRITSLNDAITVSVNPLIFIFSSAFSLVTVYISCHKPSRIAGRVSPVEAVRYTDVSKIKRREKTSSTVSPVTMALANTRRNPKKLAVIVCSLSLSLILLNSVFSIVQGFDMEDYLKNQMVSDFSVADYSVYSAISAQDNFEGVDDGVLAGISELPGLEDAANIYFTDVIHQLSPIGQENMNKTLDFLGPRMEKNYSPILNQVSETRETGNILMHVYGAGKMVIETITNGSDSDIDFDKLSSGYYALITHVNLDYDNECSPVYNVGDMIPLTGMDGEVREFEVLAVIEYYPYALSCQHSHIIESDTVIADNIYLDLYGNRQPMMTIFNVADEYIPAADQWLEGYCELDNPNLDYRSMDFYKAEFENMQGTFYAMGGALSFILALIGILNFINSVFTSILSRKRELAMLQSVGMTGRQLKSMLFFEGMSLASMTVIFTATAGTLISFAIIRALAGQIWFFTWSFTMMPLLFATAPLAIICTVVPLACYSAMRKESIIDRLRVE